MVSDQANMKNYETTTLAKYWITSGVVVVNTTVFIHCWNTIRNTLKTLTITGCLSGEKDLLFWYISTFYRWKGTVSYLHNAMLLTCLCRHSVKKLGSLFPLLYSYNWSWSCPEHIYRNAPFRAKNNMPFDPFNPDYSPPNELYKYIDGISVSLKPEMFFGTRLFTGIQLKWLRLYWSGVPLVAPFYSFKISPLYTFLDLFALHPLYGRVIIW